ncbi:hypothetical protein PmNV_104 [Penaeus monodon nudivirus]|uniref:Uncharacterized protein n=1 Tax=Penaeus monodon nudivirus TaxID=1529056 RepID=A0A076FCE0_9VIRU|nr:hypothetical protein PmNV_104 [Penaeus monodon nudivirus]AII15892.1 hypothetical protein PmNV_104 [Penaeus monodon nudivirus]
MKCRILHNSSCCSIERADVIRKQQRTRWCYRLRHISSYRWQCSNDSYHNPEPTYSADSPPLLLVFHHQRVGLGASCL